MKFQSILTSTVFVSWILAGCSSERILTAQEIEAGCQVAKQQLKSVRDKYSQTTKNLTDRYAGTKVNSSMFENSYATLKPLADEVAQQERAGR